MTMASWLLGSFRVDMWYLGRWLMNKTVGQLQYAFAWFTVADLHILDAMLQSLGAEGTVTATTGSMTKRLSSIAEPILELE